MLDRRQESRQPVYLGAAIAFDGKRAGAECIVRNASDSGAKLIVHSNAFVPDEFDLRIPLRKMNVRAHVKWRRTDMIGVAFETAEPAQSTVAADIARKLRTLRRINSELRRRLGD